MSGWSELETIGSPMAVWRRLSPEDIDPAEGGIRRAALMAGVDAAFDAYFTATGTRAIAVSEGIRPVLYRLSLNFREIAPEGERVTVAVQLRALARASMTMAIRWGSSEAPSVGEGAAIWVWIERESGRPGRIPRAAEVAYRALEGSLLRAPRRV
ncbi:MAG: hypothetical protein IPK80_22435 [Nannocystis sp.]|nr:hypothetical protein [Nannocystis sp.]